MKHVCDGRESHLNAMSCEPHPRLAAIESLPAPNDRQQATGMKIKEQTALTADAGCCATDLARLIHQLYDAQRAQLKEQPRSQAERPWSIEQAIHYEGLSTICAIMICSYGLPPSNLD